MPNLTIDLNPPRVEFGSLKEGNLFVWNGGLWMVYSHLRQSSAEPGLYHAVLISNQDAGGYRHQAFEPQHLVTPCVVDMKVSRLG